MITSSIIAGKSSENGNGFLVSANPITQKALKEKFTVATPDELNLAVKSAEEAFSIFRGVSNKKKAELLLAIADEIEGIGDDLIFRAMDESGLPEGRVRGERGRTCGQLRLFADLVKEGSWVNAVIDEAIPDRKPLPRVDIRKVLEPIGPVAVFGASNFPLAFSTAGGDTASALAAGCPVIVKAHPSHLGTNALVAEAIGKALKKCDLPPGIFSTVIGGVEIGQSLVQHPKVKAVGFTGSLKAGKAIMKIAADRLEPIPVYAEMGSINPVIVLSDIIKNKTSELATSVANSVNLGSGQFCTNPGLIIFKNDDQTTNFLAKLTTAFKQLKATPMLNESIYKNYEAAKNACLNHNGIELGFDLKSSDEAWVGNPCFIKVAAKEYMKSKALQQEVFGPFTVVVVAESDQEIIAVINEIEGQLTGTIFGEKDELINSVSIVSALKEKVGRLIFNGLPTGVEVGHAMHHGGPFPAASNALFTSVGTDAIYRFVRPICYQNTPIDLLPAALKPENPLGIWRKTNGELSRK
jgi:NADP-dependent aldehyde dehydrogenase